jgi:Flp pilus assembly protein TadB
MEALLDTHGLTEGSSLRETRRRHIKRFTSNMVTSASLSLRSADAGLALCLALLVIGRK